ncbi:hypothetical protein EBM89_00490, partial [Cellulomonas triticagri]
MVDVGGRPTARSATTPAGKISPPVAPAGHLERPRLLGALDDALAAHRTVLVAAPAGFGKSCLLASWVSHRTTPVAWVSVDGLDDDPGRLARVLADAVERARPGTLTARWTAAADAATSRRVDALLADVEAAGADLTVVLDDVHTLSSATARTVLAPLLRYPAMPRVVVAGRHDTTLPVNRMRISGDLGELRAGALAFTRDEVAAFARLNGTAADAAGVATLWDLTQGWPVAVRLAVAAGLLDRDLATVQPLAGTDVPITGYLVEEVIGTLPPDLASFVLLASTADALDADLAEALVPGGSAALEQCADRGVFLTRAGGQGGQGGLPVYRWHSLVAAHARTLLQRRDPAAAQRAHRVTAEHLRRRDPAAAITHALAGGDPA